MARYADGLIADGEHILLRTRQHWFSIVAYTIAFWVLVLISVGFFLLGRVTNWDVFNWITLISFVGALLWIAWRYASWSFQDYIVTNRRVMQVEGIINKVSSDSSLEKINDAVLRQGLLGRLLHFGDLDILTASENTVDQFRMLNDAANFKKTMLNAKYSLEREVSSPMPSPPLRVAAVGTAGDVSGGLAPAAAVPADDGDAAMTPAQVTDTLRRLADLRDRGAISAADYEAKKAELLGRI
jgi:membrane protein YdbS with pleckstrin-like domain